MQRGGLENAIFPNGSEREGGEEDRERGREKRKKADEPEGEGTGRAYNECGDHSGGNVTI